ncbi:MAG: preprotein translocase subunit SecG [Endomicrobium sp.]|jgi:preprotein translocase subunit SecG|nr:preprotein translocase subunit SecG [Endomicrobium sp.]
MFFILKFVHYSMCVILIFIVLLQTGKSGGMFGIFGNDGSDQLFNAPSRAAFIKKLTSIVACIFLITSLMLTRFYVDFELISVTDKISNAPVSVD